MLKLIDPNVKFPKLYPKVTRKLATVDEEGWDAIDSKVLRKGIDMIYQDGMQDAMLSTPVDVLFLGGQPGGGKATSCKSDVCTPDGFVKCGELKINDTISGVDGKSQKVIGVYDQGTQDVYRVKFIDGSHCDCTLDHLWKVRESSSQTKAHRKSKAEDRVELGWRIRNFEYIKKYLDEKAEGKHKGHNLLIPLCDPVEFNIEYSLPINPYTLGLMIGDGSLCGRGNGLSFTSIDKQLVDNLIDDGFDIKWKEGDRHHAFTSRFWKKKFQSLNLWGTRSDTKFIPEVYKYAYIQDRKDLIAGLMDTDGYVDNRGHMSYCTVSKQLAEDVQFIIQSLGGKATIFEKQGSYKNTKGEKVICKMAYNIHIQTKFNRELVRLDRKKERCVDGFNGGFSPLCRRIVGYEYIGKEECRCIKVSNPDSLYIATKNFIVTHNTFGILLSALDGIEKRGYGALIIKKQLVSTKETAGGIIQDAKRVFSDYADCQFSSSDNPTFAFPTWGSNISFTHSNFESTTEKRRQEAQEKAKNFQCSHIFFDELTDFDYGTWSYWLTRNRDSSGVLSKMICTFNTNSHHFTRAIIDWYIGSDGKVIQDRIGKVRYFIRQGDSARDWIWGDTVKEVVDKASIEIPQDQLDAGMTPEKMVKSFTFMPCKMSENRVLVNATAGGHIANIYNSGGTEKEKLFDENWNAETGTEATVTKEMIERIFDNPVDNDETMYATLDVSGGGDGCEMVIWKGLTIINFEQFKANNERKVYEELELWIRFILNKYDIPVENLAFDATGNGQYLKSYSDGRPIIANSRVIPEYDSRGNLSNVDSYFNLRSQLMEKMKVLIDMGLVSCQVDKYKLFEHGKNKTSKTLIEILSEESNVFVRVDRNGKWYYLLKQEFKNKYHFSPDKMDAIIYRAIFELDQSRRKEAVIEYDESDYEF